MQQFGQFVVDNWMLFALLGVIMVLLAKNLTEGFAPGSKSVTPVELNRLVKHEKGVVLDIRNDVEYDGGHILNAINVPRDKLPDRMKELQKYKKRPVVVCCPAGTTAARASTLLKKDEFESVYILKGGIAAWQAANLPLVKT